MTIQRLLIGMDFSDTAIDAAKWARQHFTSDAAITLVHIIDLPCQPHFVRITPPEPAVVEAAARG